MQQKQTSYSVEYAHIYTDESVNGNHKDSVEVLKEIKDVTTQPLTTAVLIDDYNAANLNFSTENFLNKLSEYGAVPDFYAYESDLVPLAGLLLDAIDKPKISRMYLSYIERKGKYPCSLLTATWYLIRLGRIDAGSALNVINPELSASDIASDRLINILPVSFNGVERDAHKLIGWSKFKDDRFKIQPILFQERHPVRDGFQPERVAINN